MSDLKSTNDIRLIAQEVVHQQSEVCQARRENIMQQLESMAEMSKANMENISILTTTVATLSATVQPVVLTAKENASTIERLKGRPAVWAAIGAALPTLLGVLLWWFSK